MRSILKVLRNRGVKRLAIGLLDQSRRFLNDGATIASIRSEVKVLEAKAASLKATGSVQTDETLDRAIATLQQLLSVYDNDMGAAYTWPAVNSYNNWTTDVFGKPIPAPNYWLHASFPYDSPWGREHLNHIAALYMGYERSLLATEVHAKNVPGAIVEFGLYHGQMLGQLLEEAEKLGMSREVFGFDSFEGLSEPSATDDHAGWHKGQYAASLEQVSTFLKAAERPHLTLVKGWVEDTLVRAPATSIKQIAYARVDVDIYPPTVDCLKFLSHRLADGAILAFDDWSFDPNKGETKAFCEWAPRVPHLKFEFLGSITCRFYMRVRHR
jgi:Macrocin-O-methyltransferase (TylF)